MTEKLKNIGSIFLRFGLSALLLGWLFSKIDFKEITLAIKEADHQILLGALGVFVLCNIFVWFRWKLLMQALKLRVGYIESFKWFLVGIFSSLFLPSAIGGDVIKGLGLAQKTQDKPKVFAAIVLDRLSGFTGIILLSSVAFIVGKELVSDQSISIGIMSMAAVSAAIAAVIFSKRLFSLVKLFFSRWPKVTDALARMHDDIMMLRAQKSKAILSIAISIVAQIILAYCFYVSAIAMHQDINIKYFIIFSPIVCVVTSLPSIGGLGVREIGWVYLLHKVGVEQHVALSLSLLNFSFMVILGLVGGLWYGASLFTRRVQHR